MLRIENLLPVEVQSTGGFGGYLFGTGITEIIPETLDASGIFCFLLGVKL